MRVSFFVDGFNLYHSIKSAERHSFKPLRWLDLYGLCRTLVATSLPPGAQLESVHYFSALAAHLEARKPDVVRRHRTFISALEKTGVEVTLAKFKRKRHLHRLQDFSLRFPGSRRWWRIPLSSVTLCHYSHEEKETDVAIACKLLQHLSLKKCDAAVVVSGDTDLVPAVRTARELFVSSPVTVAFPFDRHNKQLQRFATNSIKLSRQLYEAHQLPAALTSLSGMPIDKPATW